MLCGAFPLLIVSEKVKNDWEKDGIKGFRSYDIKINNVNSQKLKSIESPHYHHIVNDGRCELDLEKMDVQIKKKCSQCGNIEFKKPVWQIDKFFIKENTWDGSDLFISNFFPFKVLVTEMVVLSACKNKHTNFRFVEIENSMDSFAKALNLKQFCQQHNK